MEKIEGFLNRTKKCALHKELRSFMTTLVILCLPSVLTDGHFN